MGSHHDFSVGLLGRGGSQIHQTVPKGAVMPVHEQFIPAVLAERARRQPDDIAYTFIDYEVDRRGLPKA